MRLLLVAVLAVPAAAAGKFPDCVHVAKGSSDLQPSLEALRDCQERVKQRLFKKDPNVDKLEKLEEFQRAEAKDWIERSSSPTDYSKTAVDTGDDPKAAPPPEAAKPKHPRKDKHPLMADEKDMAVAAGLDEAGMKDLEARTRAASGPGGAFTPETARHMLDSIQRQQKEGASDEMKSLLEAVSGGGPVTPETMEKLRAAAQNAKGQGLDLGLGPEQEHALLDDASGAPPASPPRD